MVEGRFTQNDINAVAAAHAIWGVLYGSILGGRTVLVFSRFSLNTLDWHR